MSSSKSSSVLPSSSVDTTSGDEHDVIKPRDTVANHYTAGATQRFRSGGNWVGYGEGRIKSLPL